MEYRYLIYDVDKHQSSPTLFKEIPNWAMQEDSLSVVVDLQERKRFWYGEWADIYINNYIKGE